MYAYDLFIDGLVHISTLENDDYQFDAAKQRLIGENSGMQYRLGDKIRIKVEAVHLENKMVDFSLIGSERKPRRELEKNGERKLRKFLKSYRPNPKTQNEKVR